MWYDLKRCCGVINIVVPYSFSSLYFDIVINFPNEQFSIMLSELKYALENRGVCERTNERSSIKWKKGERIRLSVWFDWHRRFNLTAAHGQPCSKT